MTDTQKPGAARYLEWATGRRTATDLDRAWKRFDAILEQIDRIPDAAQPIDPLEWDEHGLPK